MRILKIDPENPDKKIISLAAQVIKNGGVVIYPTDTIYGIGANALDKRAIEKVYRIKERPDSKPLSIVVRDIKMAKEYCTMHRKEQDIFKSLLPGAFTLIFLAKKSKKGIILTEFNGTLSVRIPDHKITTFLAKKLKTPYTATSANLSGLPGSGDINNILDQLKGKESEIDLVLDGGILPKKNPSVIIDLTRNKPKIVRK